MRCALRLMGFSDTYSMRSSAEIEQIMAPGKGEVQRALQLMWGERDVQCCHALWLQYSMHVFTQPHSCSRSCFAIAVQYMYSTVLWYSICVWAYSSITAGTKRRRRAWYSTSSEEPRPKRRSRFGLQASLSALLPMTSEMAEGGFKPSEESCFPCHNNEDTSHTLIDPENPNMDARRFLSACSAKCEYCVMWYGARVSAHSKTYVGGVSAIKLIDAGRSDEDTAANSLLKYKHLIEYLMNTRINEHHKDKPCKSNIPDKLLVRYKFQAVCRDGCADCVKYMLTTGQVHSQETQGESGSYGAQEWTDFGDQNPQKLPAFADRNFGEVRGLLTAWNVPRYSKKT